MNIPLGKRYLDAFLLEFLIDGGVERVKNLAPEDRFINPTHQIQIE